MPDVERKVFVLMSNQNTSLSLVLFVSALPGIITAILIGFFLVPSQSTGKDKLLVIIIFVGACALMYSIMLPLTTVPASYWKLCLLSGSLVGTLAGFAYLARLFIRQAQSAGEPAAGFPVIQAMTDVVPENAIDYDEVFRLGGRNCGDEDFALFKCPACGRIYLLEYEVDTAYLDPDDLSRRANVVAGSFDCVECGRRIPENQPWIGPKANPKFHVTWPELKESRWAWIARPPEL